MQAAELQELEELTAATDAFFARAAREEAGASLLYEEAFDLSQRHFSMAEALRASAIAYKEPQQWVRVRGAARNALRLRPEDDSWSAGAADGSAGALLTEAEAALDGASGGGGGGGGGGKILIEERTVQAPDENSFEVWRSALTSLADEVFSVRTPPLCVISRSASLGS